jgi:PIN domain nuclease of toxin-antitoxin system
MTRTSEPRPLLLDTHVWLWFMLADAELAISKQNLINRAAALGQLRIAAISIWEAALLASRGRVVLGRPLAQWMTEAVSAPGLSIEPLSLQVAVEGCCLPEVLHRDPADRLIVATARVANASLMTRDRRILDYAARGHLSAIAA